MIKNIPHIAPINKPANKKYSIIIPAAGMGLRMKSYGPKSLIKIKGKTILEHQIKTISTSIKHFEIILVAGLEYDRVVRSVSKNIKVLFNKDYETNNVCSSVKIGLAQASYNDVIIINGDVVCNNNALSAPFGIESMMIIDSSDTMGHNEVGCTIHNNKVENVLYGLEPKWAQIVYFTGYELNSLKTLLNTDKHNNKFLFEIINHIIGCGGKFTSYAPKNIMAIDIDNSRDMKIAEGIV